jgi:Domain of unknown function (DUF6794)
LAKNWTTFLQDNIRLPETVDEAVERLMAVLEDEAKSEIRSMAKEDLIELHFSLGMAIRNAFDLHVPWSKLLASCGVVHPDDASGVIIRALWRRL